jgi:hypothetical protein
MKRKEGPSDKAKLRVLKLNGYKCSYCGAPGSEAELEIDHIIPVSKGGSNHIANLTTACRTCNQQKSDSLDFTSKKKFSKQDKEFVGQMKSNSLVGMFIHIFENGILQYQGEIIREVGEFVIIDLFSWLHGYPTGSTLARKTEEILTSDTYILYSTAESWNRNAEEIQYRESIEKKKDRKIDNVYTLEKVGD